VGSPSILGFYFTFQKSSENLNFLHNLLKILPENIGTGIPVRKRELLIHKIFVYF
jgi:hypothetical protein